MTPNPPLLSHNLSSFYSHSPLLHQLALSLSLYTSTVAIRHLGRLHDCINDQAILSGDGKRSLSKSGFEISHILSEHDADTS
jgi:hypothetical protein